MRVLSKIRLASMVASIALSGCSNMQQSLHDMAQSADLRAAQRYGATIDQGSQQVVSPSSTKGWPIVENYGDTVMQVPPGQTDNDWQESYTVIYDADSQSVVEGVNKKVSAVLQHCSGSTVKRLSQNANSATLVFNISPSCAEGSLITIVKVMQGKEGVYFAQYSARQTSVSSAEIARMRSAILGVRLG